ncbi:peptide ABC transporter ATP-binding protein [Paenibacillus baekrokdamisoli]|uniref:Nickel import system ATP-binding protein NikD n=1 Tax=Paenibacillus baekrokdamisoli TaxID=1712516 RepID=A0A3G9J9T3_9BACL|nr:ABC transporter ATP-binding protein [Paenibacillus baekrokdamisoli]MBB3070685.1 peptide/nickel transport system ATP-binding protein [Paenibacillus baekrokdamisoli]BBH20034.1 peptide ABC transporter ATP-binding protein [Paenibacillus baekrokdamisoli]
MAEKILQIRNLTTAFLTDQGVAKATDRVTFDLEKGQTLCVVGESGSGKSVTALSVMRLIDYAGGVIMDGEVLFNGEDLVRTSQDDMLRIRGNLITMIFQDPMSALNPVFTVGDQIAEVLRIHRRMKKKAAWQRSVEMLKLVGIPDPEIRAKQFPYEMSGGMCQRVVIAMALACNPELLIADEPTTALDVTVQAQILELLLQLKKELGMSMLLITHDMGVAAEVADRIAVMYAGIVVEEGTVQQIFENSRHPYTIGLLQSIPGMDGKRGGELYTIKGSIPPISKVPSGCRFHPRCPHVMDICRTEEPLLKSSLTGHKTACWLEDKGEFDLKSNKGNNQEANRLTDIRTEATHP